MPALLLALVSLRAFAGDADHDGIKNGKDACRDEPESINRWRDDDGCPDQLGTLEVLVLDLAGKQVFGAVARLDTADLRTDPSGKATFRDLIPEQVVPLTIGAPGYTDWTGQDATIVEGSARVVATLDWSPVEVRVEARDTEHQAPIAALVRADGPGFVESQETGDDGDVILGLRPGTWTLRVEAPRFETATYTLTVTPNAVVPPTVVALRPAWLTLTDLDLSFPASSATIGADRDAALRKAAAAMFALPEVSFVVTGHPDPRDLARLRAEAVRAQLIAAGVDPAQVSVTAASDPLATPWLDAGRAANRSVKVLPTVPPTEDPAPLEALAVRFLPGSHRLADDSPIATLAADLIANPAASVELIGRSDDSDLDDLGHRRAEAAVAWWVSHGVAAGRLTATQGPPSTAGLSVRPTEEDRGPLRLPHELYFRPGSTELLPESAGYLPEIGALLRAKPDARVMALGHTRDDELETAGASLSTRRAEAVRQALATSADLTVGAVGTRLPARLPPDAAGIGGYVSFAVLPPPLLAADPAGLATALASHPGVRVEVTAHAPDGAQARTQAVAASVALLAEGADPAQVATTWAVDGEARVEVEVVWAPLDRELAFADGSATLTPAAGATLEQALPAALAAPRQVLEIVGRASPAETEGVPDVLARARAEAVAQWLIAHGVDPTRLTTAGTRGTGTTVRGR